jgi:NADH pyrophosphatase NudC (nudix superfamily)
MSGRQKQDKTCRVVKADLGSGVDRSFMSWSHSFRGRGLDLACCGPLQFSHPETSGVSPGPQLVDMNRQSRFCSACVSPNESEISQVSWAV